MKPEIIIGCSSFNESYWKGVFYPEDLLKKDWFSYYCRFFTTYEMNGTFYKFPTDKSLINWYVKAPEDFLFSVKMYKAVTHFKKFKDCQREISDFYTVCRDNLKEKLAYVLFQLPPSFTYSNERLELILSSLDYTFKNVIEFRHISWWNDEVYAAFRDKSVVFCNVSYPQLPEDMIKTAPESYLRFHGVPKLFYSEYGQQQLKSKHDEIFSENWEKVFVYFNNTASAAGITDALVFRKLLSDK